VLLWRPDVFNAEASRHCGASERLLRPIRTVAQEPVVLTWKLHGIFMDIFLETCGHTHGMKWDTVHITWRLWIEPIIHLKSNRYIKCFCQPECCQHKILTQLLSEKLKVINIILFFSLFSFFFLFYFFNTKVIPLISYPNASKILITDITYFKFHTPQTTCLWESNWNK
jgi:hypothetical protein